MSGHDQKYLAVPGRARKIGQLVTALDIGATKISCLISRTTPPSQGGLEVIGHGQQSSRGVKGGVVIDMEGLERAVRLAVEDAERAADVQVTGIRLGLSSASVTTHLVRGEIDMNGREISQKDVHRLLERTIGAATDEKLHILHAVPFSYSIDGNDGVRDPRGMFAEKLGVAMNVVTMPMPVYRNLVLCVSRAHLSVESVNAAGFAAADAILTDDERDNGAICIDLGGGNTDVVAFMNGTLGYLETLSVGGMHVTSDLAHGIGTTVPAAERIKNLYGNVLDKKSGPTEFIEVPIIGDDGRLQASRLPRSDLTKYMTPRVEETFELISKRLSASGLGGRLPRRVVLTGGGSDLPGIRELASRVLGMPVRLGRPVRGDEFGEVCQRPSLSAAVGLLTLGMTGPGKSPQKTPTSPLRSHAAGDGSVFGKAFVWIKENI